MVSENDLLYEVSVLLEGMLYFAGVDKKNLQKASELYVELIDEALGEMDLKGVDEPVAVVKYLKQKHPELFRK